MGNLVDQAVSQYKSLIDAQQKIVTDLTNSINEKQSSLDKFRTTKIVFFANEYSWMPNAIYNVSVSGVGKTPAKPGDLNYPNLLAWYEKVKQYHKGFDDIQAQLRNWSDEVYGQQLFWTDVEKQFQNRVAFCQNRISSMKKEIEALKVQLTEQQKKLEALQFESQVKIAEAQKLEIEQLEAQTQATVDVALKDNTEYQTAKIQSALQTELAKQTATTDIERKKLEEESKRKLYLYGGIGVIVIVLGIITAVILLRK